MSTEVGQAGNGQHEETPFRIFNTYVDNIKFFISYVTLL